MNYQYFLFYVLLISINSGSHLFGSMTRISHENTYQHSFYQVFLMKYLPGMFGHIFINDLVMFKRLELNYITIIIIVLINNGMNISKKIVLLLERFFVIFIILI